MHGSVLFRLSLCHARFPRSDACCPALLMDALMIRRALFEPFDKTCMVFYSTFLRSYKDLG